MTSLHCPSPPAIHLLISPLWACIRIRSFKHHFQLSQQAIWLAPILSPPSSWKNVLQFSFLQSPSCQSLSSQLWSCSSIPFSNNEEMKKSTLDLKTNYLTNCPISNRSLVSKIIERILLNLDDLISFFRQSP